jgi:hypothetical protein
VLHQLASSFVLACFGVVVLKTSYARANDAAMSFGEQLLTVGPSLAGDVKADYYTVSINEQPIAIATGATTRPIEEVVSYFENECKTHAEGLPDRFVALDDSLRELTPSTGKPGFGTVATQRGPKAFVVCFAVDHELTQTEKFDRIHLVATTGDLSKLGDVRYVTMEKLQVGEGTHVVSAWTKGAFNLVKAFPKDGDAPGHDWPDAPRPEGSRRIFTAGVEGATAGVTVYQVDGASNIVEERVRGALAGAGWKILHVPDQVPQFSKAFGRSGNDLLVTVHEGEPGKSTVAYMYSVGLPTSRSHGSGVE